MKLFRLALLILLCLSVQSCTESTTPIPALEITPAPDLAILFPNVRWKMRNGQADPIFEITFRDNPGAPIPREVCTRDIGADQTIEICEGRTWDLIAPTSPDGHYIVRQYAVDNAGNAAVLIEWRIDAYEFDHIWYTPVLPFGSGTPQRLDRE